jgi:hypothetical protein
MSAFISTIVFTIQIALAGFVAWGGWLAVRIALAPAKPAPTASRPQAGNFERVASLVLLALLCTTLLPIL